MSAGVRVTAFAALLAVVFLLGLLAGRALHPMTRSHAGATPAAVAGPRGIAR